MESSLSDAVWKFLRRFAKGLQDKKSVAITVLFLTGAFVFWSAPTIRIRSSTSTFQLQLPGAFRNAELTFDQPISVTGLHIQAGNGTARVVDESRRQGLKVLQISNTLNVQAPTAIATIFYEGSLVVVSGGRVDGHEVAFDELSAMIRADTVEPRAHRYAQDVLADRLAKYYAELANLLMSAMLVILGLLTIYLGWLLIPLWSSQRFRAMVDRRLGSTPSETAFFEALYSPRDRWLSLLQRTAPLVGFALTIGGLIVGYYGLSGGSDQRSAAVVLGALQNALGSSLLGLSIALVCSYCRYANDSQFQRWDQLLPLHSSEALDQAAVDAPHGAA